MSKTFLNLTNNWLLPSQNALRDCHQNLHWRLLRGYIPLLPCHLSILDKEFHLCAVHIHDFSHLRDTRLFFNFYCATLLYSICQGLGGLTPHWLMMTPTHVTEKFGLEVEAEVGFDPPFPLQQHQHNIKMTLRYFSFPFRTTQ